MIINLKICATHPLSLQISLPADAFVISLLLHVGNRFLCSTIWGYAEGHLAAHILLNFSCSPLYLLIIAH